MTPCDKVDRVIAALEEKKKKGELTPEAVLELLKRL